MLLTLFPMTTIFICILFGTICYNLNYLLKTLNNTIREVRLLKQFVTIPSTKSKYKK